jgi:hypothetical protein
LQDIGLFAVTEFQCAENEHDDEDDSKFRSSGLKNSSTQELKNNGAGRER